MKLIRRLVAILTLGCLIAPPGLVAAAEPRSSILAEIVRNPTIETRLYERLADEGAPLVEKVEGKKDQRLVTFVYRAPHDTPVWLETNLDTLVEETAPFPLVVLPGTEIHYYSLEVRSDLRATYHFLVGTERTPQTDSFARETHTMIPDFPRSAFSLENAPPQPWAATPTPGEWREHRFLSPAFAQEAEFDVYRPAGFNACAEKAVLIGMDRYAYREALPAARIVEYMKRTRSSPCVLLVAAPDLGEPDSKGGYGTAVEFLADELVPWLEEEYSTDFEPERTIISGLSRRGMVATFAAFSRPDVFGRVLSLTGTYIWSPEGEQEPEWLPRQFAETERRPIRLFLAAGLLETAISPRNEGIYPLAASRHMRNVLRAKGYDHRYREFYGVHSTFNWQDMLLPGLTYLLDAETSD